MKITTLISGGALLFALLVAALFFFRPQSFSWLGWRGGVDVTGSMTVEYQKGNPSIRVNNGKVVAHEQYNLSFPFSGRVESVIANEGQVLSDSGQPLLQLEKTEWLLEFKKSEAQYAAEQATVNKLQQGARFEELLIVEQRKQSSSSALKGKKKEVIDAIASAFVQADDAIRNKSDDIFTNPESNPELSFVPSDSSLELQIESGRTAMKRLLDNWENDVEKMKASGDVAKYLDGARKKIKDVREYLDKVAKAVNALEAGVITQETIDSWKEAVSAGRTAVAEAEVILGGAESIYRVTSKDLAVAQSELDYKLAGVQKQDIEAALSAAVAARSQMDMISEKLKQTTLTTPLKNLVVKEILPKQGEYVAAGEPVVTLVHPMLEIELDIPEEKIAGIQIGNQVIMRLNAYPYEDTTGTITEIKSQEIEKDGGIYFRVRASIINVSEKIRTGMTGDVIVETSIDGGVLRIPRKAIYEKDGRRLVTVVYEGKPQLRVIESGVEKDGWVEILSGLQVGDRILSEVR